MRSTSCMCCGKTLTVGQSIERGLGPICAARKAADLAENPHASKVDLPFDPIAKDIIAERRSDGLHFNIYHVISYHSGDGFEFGYGGSGPADFALNILEMFVRELGHKPVLSTPNGKGGPKFCELSWSLHQDFKWKFIATMDSKGGTIKGDDIRTWIDANKGRFALAA